MVRFWGRHKLASEPTTCRTPPSNSLVEVESSRCKTTLLTVSCGLSAHVANLVGLGSFSPYLYSRNLLSLPFGLKILLTLTPVSREYFLPESPPFQMIVFFTRR